MELSTERSGQGMPILCLHGHPGTGRCMAVFTEDLSSSFQTIAPDLRGYGRSRANGPFAMDQHLEDLSQLLQTIDQPCLILGWSLGGILAMELAINHPAQVRGLILVGTAARPVGRHPRITWQDNLLTGLAGIINWVAPGWQWNIDTFGQRSLFRYLISQHSHRAYCRLAREGTPAFLQTSKFANRALNAALRQGYNRLDQLCKISQPCLMLAAANDVHITPESSQETATTLPNCDCRLYDNVAHLMPWEIETQLCQDIRQWLRQQDFLEPVSSVRSIDCGDT